MFMPYVKPFIDTQIITKSFFGDNTLLLKNKIQQKTGKKYSIFTSDCRTALYLACLAIEPKGEILLSPLVCETAVTPIIASGHKPKFVDLDFNSSYLNLKILKENISDSTRAILLVHLGGIPAPIDKIKNIVKERNILIIEDCAHSFDGIGLSNNPSGVSGDISCFNFSKSLYGMGGMFLTNDELFFNKANSIHNKFPARSFKIILFRIIRNYIQKTISSRFSYYFYKYFMSLTNFMYKKKGNDYNLYIRPYQYLTKPLKYEANYTWRMIEKYWQSNKNGRLRVYRLFVEKILQSSKITLLGTNPESNPLTRLYILTNLNADYLINKLITRFNIECKHLSQDYKIPFKPFLGHVDYFKKKCLWTDCPVAEKIHLLLLSLPFYSTMSEDDIDYIITSVEQNFE